MKIRVKREALLRELALAQGAVEKSTSTIPILSHVLLDAGGERCSITGTDLDLAVRCSCAADVEEAGAIAIPAKRFVDYVKLLPGEDIELSGSDKNWISVVCGPAKARMAGMSQDSWPGLPTMEEGGVEIPGDVLAGMIARTEFAISHEQSRFTLDGAKLLAGEGLSLVATDGHRLALCWSGEDVDAGVLVPRRALGQLAKLCAAHDGPVRFLHQNHFLFFQLGTRMLMSRELTGNFPDFRRVLPGSHGHEIELDRAELKSAIERVAQFSDERSRAIRVTVRAGELVLHSSVSETGESEESIAVDFDDAGVEIGFNASYLLDFLKVVTAEKVKFLFSKGKAPGEFQPVGESGEGYRYVVMPMRM